MACTTGWLDWGVSENRGTLFGGPYNKDPTIWGTILGSPIFGNPHWQVEGPVSTEEPKSHAGRL